MRRVSAQCHFQGLPGNNGSKSTWRAQDRCREESRHGTHECVRYGDRMAGLAPGWTDLTNRSADFQPAPRSGGIGRPARTWGSARQPRAKKGRRFSVRDLNRPGTEDVGRRPRVSVVLAASRKRR